MLYNSHKINLNCKYTSVLFANFNRFLKEYTLEHFNLFMTIITVNSLYAHSQKDSYGYRLIEKKGTIFANSFSFSPSLFLDGKRKGEKNNQGRG